ncbi:Zinc finger HIT domain-containing protein 2 [Trichoplax sp. H2]|nr:Zinc finger HIT domain-containing protein 2 [Trichoplax sp. H2]|eukprot:RDD41776.1 Zinc finger HIT domain-containing protein 2 [Trichoplax sp. H2]
MDDIKITETEGSIGKQDRICELCRKCYSRYTCPRCNINYCSLQCYKCQKHQQCSEVFYKDHVMEELKNNRASQDDKEKILNILQRLNESESMHEEDSDGLSLSERLSDLNLDKDLNVVWEKLSEKEKQDFEQCLTNGDISRLISLWQPWWRTNVAKGERIKVVDNDDDGKSQVKQNGLLPKLHRDFLSPESIGNYCNCFEDIRINKNIRYSYAYTCRLFNGGHFDNPLESIQVIFQISNVLKENAVYQEATSALHYAIRAVENNKVIYNSAEFSMAIIDDVHDILSKQQMTENGKCSFTMLALSDLYRLSEIARKTLTNGTNASTAINNGIITSKILWYAKKKIYFYLSWASKRSNDFMSIATTILLERDNLKLLLNQHEGLKRKVEDVMHNKAPRFRKLVEEL